MYANNPKKVLVIEDNETDRAIMRIVLKRFGFEILEAKNGKEVLEMCSKYEYCFDLILIDGNIPEVNPDTSILVPLIRKYFKKTLISTTSDDSVSIKHIALGCNGHIGKDVIVDKLPPILRQITTQESLPSQHQCT